MRYIILVLLLFGFLLLPLSTFSSNNFEYDKYLHFSVSFSLSITYNYFFGFCGDFLALGTGLLKEIWDYFSEKNVCDPEDLYADIIGVLAAKTYIETLNQKASIGFCLFF
ncbi:MAG: hypothetical protein R6U52_04285 [Kosmotogaceae bacterium]